MGGRHSPRATTCHELSTVEGMPGKEKTCSKCCAVSKKLFRCRYNNKKEWDFLCQDCLNQIKIKYSTTYQYGGTWKATN